MKKRLIYGLLVLTALILVYWLHTHAFIEISLADSVSGEVNHSIKDQRSGRVAEIKTTDASVKRLVRRGSHEVLVKHAGQSYFAIVATGGWLGTARVSADTAPEHTRQFIGDSPAECMKIVAGVLISAACIDNFANVEVHLPATDTLPTRVRKLQTHGEGIVEGMFNAPSGNFVLVQSSEQNRHLLYPISEQLVLGEPVALNELMGTRAYRALAYKTGFVVIDEPGNDALYYATPGSVAEKIDLGSTDKAELYAYAFDTDGEKLVFLRGASSAAAHDPHSEEFEEDVRQTDVEVVLYQNGSASRITLGGEQPADIRFCGTGKLCLLRHNNLEVFDLMDNELVLKYRVTGVNAVESLGEDMILVREQEVLNLQVDKARGLISYSTDRYGTCGLSAAGNHYLLCIINAKAKSSALLIDRSKPDTDSVDKKIAALIQIPEIRDLSIYKNRIFVSPELGSLRYLPEEGGYGYDQETIHRVNEAIYGKLNQLGVSSQKYQVINSFE